MNTIIKKYGVIICEYCGKNFYDYFYRQRRFCSNKCSSNYVIKNKIVKGENNPRYIDGLSKIDYNAWKRRYRVKTGRQKTNLEKFGGTKGLHAPNGQLLKTIANRHRRRALGEMKIEDIQFVYEENIKQFKTLTCVYCLKSIKFGEDQIDHIMPIIRGGTHERSNLTISCKFCNNQKHDKTVEEYIEWKKQGGNKRLRIKENLCH